MLLICPLFSVFPPLVSSSSQPFMKLAVQALLEGKRKLTG